MPLQEFTRDNARLEVLQRSHSHNVSISVDESFNWTSSNPDKWCCHVEPAKVGLEFKQCLELAEVNWNEVSFQLANDEASISEIGSVTCSMVHNHNIGRLRLDAESARKV